jgi:hypothetical protein
MKALDLVPYALLFIVAAVFARYLGGQAVDMLGRLPL